MIVPVAVPLEQAAIGPMLDRLADNVAAVSTASVVVMACTLGIHHLLDRIRYHDSQVGTVAPKSGATVLPRPGHPHAHCQLLQPARQRPGRRSWPHPTNRTSAAAGRHPGHPHPLKSVATDRGGDRLGHPASCVLPSPASATPRVFLGAR